MNMDSKNRYYEGCGQEGPILCIFFCEFHSTYGPKISCQVPAEFISKETFESVNVYLIPKHQLIQSIITVTLDDIKIVGYPVMIQNEKYPRNAFYYNVCFVCDSWARSNQYDQVVKDLSAYLRQLEEDENLLSKMEEGGDYTKVITLFGQILSDLNSTRFSSLQEGKRSVTLRVGRPRQVEVPDSAVPMLVRSQPGSPVPYIIPRDTNLQLHTTKILQFVDGLNQVEKIASLCDVEMNQVKFSLQNLVVSGAVKLLPGFNENSIYTVTPRFRTLLLDRLLQADCVARVSQQGAVASIRDIMRAYSCLNRGASVKDLCLRLELSQLRIDEKKLIQFGLLHGFIRKVNEYVSYVGEEGSEEWLQYGQVLDGNTPIEIACSRSGLLNHEIDHFIQFQPFFISIFK